MAQTRGIAAPTVIVVALIGIGLVVATMLAPVNKNPFAPQPANAELTLDGASILGMGCTSQSSQIRWAGMPKEQTSPPALPGDDPKGTVFVCWTKYKIPEADTSIDYYAALAESYWTVERGRLDARAVASQGISSSVVCLHNVDGGTNALRSERSCTDDHNLATDVRVACTNTRAEACTVHQVPQADGATGATWTAADAATLGVLRIMYTQQVPAGKVPKFTYSFTIPQYTKAWNDGLGHWEWSSHLAHVDFRDE